MEQLLNEYHQSLAKVRQSIRRFQLKKELTEEEKETLRILRSMENDLLWSIDWMRRGSHPPNRRPIENRATYQREVLWSQLSEQAIRQLEWNESQRYTKVSKENTWLDQYLSCLSKSEYEAFVAVRGEGLSFAQTASLLQCSKSTVQSYVYRAERKLRKLREQISPSKSWAAKHHTKRSVSNIHGRIHRCHTKATNI